MYEYVVLMVTISLSVEIIQSIRRQLSSCKNGCLFYVSTCKALSPRTYRRASERTFILFEKVFWPSSSSFADSHSFHPLLPSVPFRWPVQYTRVCRSTRTFGSWNPTLHSLRQMKILVLTFCLRLRG